jgi:hypothetical protein
MVFYIRIYFSCAKLYLRFKEPAASIHHVFEYKWFRIHIINKIEVGLIHHLLLQVPKEIEPADFSSLLKIHKITQVITQLGYAIIHGLFQTSDVIAASISFCDPLFLRHQKLCDGGFCIRS